MKAISVCALALVLLVPVRFDAESAFTGEWQWKGSLGWQKFTLRLDQQGTKVSGRILMGPDSEGIRSPGDYWRYFFEPAVPPISNVRIEANRISFEQAFSAGPVSGTKSNTSFDRFFYAGTIEGDRIVFTREWTARPTAPFELGKHKVEFTMVRSGTPEFNPLPKNDEALKSHDQWARTGPVSLDVEVTAPNGQFVANLQKDDFLISENGEARTIQSFGSIDASRGYLLLYDHNLTWLENSSQSYPPNHVVNGWESLLGASTQFLSHLHAKDRVSIATFEEKIPPNVQWYNAAGANLPPISLDVAKLPGGQKDLYGVVAWALKQFETSAVTKTVIVFTDGRDGRLSPKWPRDTEGREVMDPLFGLPDVGEKKEFEELLDSVAQSDVRLYFIAINTEQDPEFGPAVVRRRISGLYPGAREGIGEYLALVRSRMEALAETSGGRVLYGGTSSDAISLYQDMYKTLAIDTAYNLKYLPAQSGVRDGNRVTVRIRDREDFRVSQFRMGEISR